MSCMHPYCSLFLLISTHLTPSRLSIHKTSFHLPFLTFSIHRAPFILFSLFIPPFVYLTHTPKLFPFSIYRLSFFSCFSFLSPRIAKIFLFLLPVLALLHCSPFTMHTIDCSNVCQGLYVFLVTHNSLTVGTLLLH